MTNSKKYIFFFLTAALLMSSGLSQAGDDTQFLPDFYDKVEPIILVDPLGSFLGAVNEGETYVYHYADIIKYSGHSCSSIAGAYKMTQIALKELYGTETPVRGQIRVTMKGSPEYQVNGPISQAISFITGAAAETGFKGIKGKFFTRQNLLKYEPENPPAEGVWAEATFQRTDNNQSVTVTYRTDLIPGNPEMGKLMPVMLSGKANEEQKKLFGEIWQEAVRIALMDPPDGTFVVSK
ncbi:MAG: FmdE family protein [Calditrichaceae bacterium]